jgi:hypothetical protein
VISEVIADRRVYQGYQVRENIMLRPIFTIGLFAVLGIIALKIAFGVLGVMVGLFIALAMIALKIGLVALAGYLVIRVVSPDTARRLRDRWTGRAV